MGGMEGPLRKEQHEVVIQEICWTPWGCVVVTGGIDGERDILMVKLGDWTGALQCDGQAGNDQLPDGVFSRTRVLGGDGAGIEDEIQWSVC